MTDRPTPRRIPRDRADPPTPGVPQSWPALSEPFVAPNGLVVETATSVDELLAIGDHFHNALELRGAAESWGKRVAEGRQHIYRVLSGRYLASCGELVVKDGKVEVQWDRAHNNGPGTPETKAAVEAYATAINDGAITPDYGIDSDGFVSPHPGPTP